MKNRVKQLCFDAGIFTPEVLAQKIGIGELTAKGIWNESIVIDFEIIESLRKFFNCSTAYMLCVDEA